MIGSAIDIRRIPKFPRYLAGCDGSIWAARDGAEPTRIKERLDRNGYSRVDLYRPEGRVTKKVSHLILETFIGPRPDGMEACHDNGRRSDNRLANLRWDTHSGNVADKKLHGTSQVGMKNGLSKLTDQQVIQIRESAAMGASFRALAMRHGVDERNIARIVRRKRWQHL
jgi:hypothetical protein